MFDPVVIHEGFAADICVQREGDIDEGYIITIATDVDVLAGTGTIIVCGIPISTVITHSFIW